MLPTTFYKNLKHPLIISANTKKNQPWVTKKHLVFQPPVDDIVCLTGYSLFTIGRKLIVYLKDVASMMNCQFTMG